MHDGRLVVNSGHRFAKLQNTVFDGLCGAQVWEAVSELRTTGNWVVTSIPRLLYAFEAALAAGQPHDLPALSVPLEPPGVPPSASPAEVHPMHLAQTCCADLSNV